MISDILPQLIRFSGISESAHNLYCLHNHFTIYDTFSVLHLEKIFLDKQDMIYKNPSFFILRIH